MSNELRNLTTGVLVELRHLRKGTLLYETYDDEKHKPLTLQMDLPEVEVSSDSTIVIASILYCYELDLPPL